MIFPFRRSPLSFRRQTSNSNMRDTAWMRENEWHIVAVPFLGEYSALSPLPTPSCLSCWVNMGASLHRLRQSVNRFHFRSTSCFGPFDFYKMRGKWDTQQFPFPLNNEASLRPPCNLLRCDGSRIFLVIWFILLFFGQQNWIFIDGLSSAAALLRSTGRLRRSVDNRILRPTNRLRGILRTSWGRVQRILGSAQCSNWKTRRRDGRRGKKRETHDYECLKVTCDIVNVTSVLRNRKSHQCKTEHMNFWAVSNISNV